MKYVLKALFAGVIALVVLWVFSYSLLRGCAAVSERMLEEARQERHQARPQRTDVVSEVLQQFKTIEKERQEQYRELERSIDEQRRKHDPNSGIFWPRLPLGK